MHFNFLQIAALLAESFLEKESHIPGVTFGTLMLFMFLFNRMNRQNWRKPTIPAKSGGLSYLASNPWEKAKDKTFLRPRACLYYFYTNKKFVNARQQVNVHKTFSMQA